MAGKAIREEVTFELVLVAGDGHSSRGRRGGQALRYEWAVSSGNGTGCEQAGNGGWLQAVTGGLEEHAEGLGCRLWGTTKEGLSNYLSASAKTVTQPEIRELTLGAPGGRPGQAKATVINCTRVQSRCKRGQGGESHLQVEPARLSWSLVWCGGSGRWGVVEDDSCICLGARGVVVAFIH